MTSPELSVVVLAWNQLPYTRRCVESIRRHTTVSYELILVDNGSDSPAREFAAAAADVSVLNEQNLGFAAGMNRGLSVARGRFVAFVNNDTRMPERWAELLVETATAPGVGAVVPAVTAAGNARTVRIAPGTTVNPLRPFELPPSAVVYLMATDVVRGLGGWGEEFAVASGEDADMAFKIWTNDLDIVFDERILVEHVGKVTATQLPNWRALWRRNGFQFLAKWSDVSTPVPRLDTCPLERFDRNRHIAASVAELLQRYFEVLEQRPLHKVLRRFAPAADKLQRWRRRRRP